MRIGHCREGSKLTVHRRIITTPEHLFLTADVPIHVNRVSESFELGEHNHEFVEINYVSEGSGFQHIGGRILPVAKGDLFYLPIGSSHVFRPASAAPKRKHLIVYNIIFNMSFVRRLLNAFPLDDGMQRFLTATYPAQPWLHVRDAGGVFQQLFDTLYDEFARKKPDYLLLIQAEVVRLLVLLRRSGAELGQAFGASAASGGTKPADPFERFVAYVREHACEPLALPALAAEAGLSERQFRRRFVAFAGMGFTDFVQKLRIERSCDRLLATIDSVAAIARDCGYQDIKFFNRLFKKRTGMTPGQYRKRGFVK